MYIAPWFSILFLSKIQIRLLNFIFHLIIILRLGHRTVPAVIQEIKCG